jgi:molecular chaperone DnaK
MAAPDPAYLGIDLGTTNSAAAVFDGSQLTEVRAAQGSTLVPSVVRIDARGAVTVGARARRFLETDPENTRTEFKRLMGTAEEIPFPASGTRRRPEALAAEILRAIREDVRDQLGFLPERAVVSVPALFELPQSAATSEAARLAGFEKVELIQEPVASALAAGWTASEDGAWLVYDLGGGTFDVSLLETEGGFLRVVGHDGDNFLGGRDFDWAIVDWVLGRIGGGRSRADAALAPALRKLKLAAEEAKIDLTRAAEAGVTLPASAGLPDIDLVLTRADLDAIAAPLIDRTVAVCRRLLGERVPARIVLVGGPTVMPALRDRVGAALGAPFAEGIDPMTVVARGAALYAASAGLDARPRSAPPPSARRLWLQYPAISPLLAPHVVGKVVAGAAEAPSHVLLRRSDGWESQKVAVGADGGFVIGVELAARRPNVFRVEATAGGRPVQVTPETLTIVQGMTVDDPPLSRSIGVATADDHVHVYVERGAPLPARRTFSHTTVETLVKDVPGAAVKIPIVQGELDRAHLCRLVGTLEIAGESIAADLPAGATIEITLEVDRGGRLAARALVPALDQVFEHVEHLLVPEARPEALEASARALRDRVDAVRGEAFRRGSAKAVDRLGEVERQLSEVARDAAAAAGGDADAGQKARRTLLEIDALLEQIDMDRKWPELDQEARSAVASTARWVAQYGTPAEQQLYADVAASVEAARAARDAVEVTRQLRLVQQLAGAARARHPEYWMWIFEAAVAESAAATDAPRAQVLIRDGKQALARGDREALRPIAQELWRLIPADAQTRHLSYDSGVR